LRFNKHLAAVVVALTALPVWASAADIFTGTAIVGILRPDEIVAAADSKELLVYSTSKKKPSGSRTVCKIREIDSAFFFSASGATLVEDSPFAFNVESIIREENKKFRNPQQVVDSAQERIRNSLQLSLQDAKRNEQNEYRKYFQTISKIEVIFFWARQGQLFVRFQAFQGIDTPETVLVNVSPDGGTCPPCQRDMIRYWTLGEREPMRKRLGQESSWKGGSLKAARRAVELAIQANPAMVGPPIDIVRISQVGIPWKDFRKECQR
jgi:hypothetical protein